MSRHARPVTLPPRVHAILLLLSRQRKLERRLAERVQMALWSADGVTSVAQARRLGVDVQRVSRWRRRLSASAARLESAAAAAPTVTTDEDRDHFHRDHRGPWDPPVTSRRFFARTDSA